jgi:hypothetical protein
VPFVIHLCAEIDMQATAEIPSCIFSAVIIVIIIVVVA